MDKRTATRLADEDTTEYGVCWRGASGYGLIRVTGYRNAKIIVKGSKQPGAVILTKSECDRARTGWRPEMPRTGE